MRNLKSNLSTNRYLPINSILLVKYAHKVSSRLGYSNTCFSTMKHAQNHGSNSYKFEILQTLPRFRDKHDILIVNISGYNQDIYIKFSIFIIWNVIHQMCLSVYNKSEN